MAQKSGGSGVEMSLSELRQASGGLARFESIVLHACNMSEPEFIAVWIHSLTLIDRPMTPDVFWSRRLQRGLSEKVKARHTRRHIEMPSIIESGSANSCLQKRWNVWCECGQERECLIMNSEPFLMRGPICRTQQKSRESRGC
jgi:hypothetical protein